MHSKTDRLQLFSIPKPIINLSKTISKPVAVETTLAQQFEEGLSQNSFKSNNMTRVTRRMEFDIYSPNSVEDLLSEKSAKNEKPDLRYLVDLDGAIWFARETHPSIPAPAHYQMTGEASKNASCWTAGNLYFSPDYKKLIKINHKSGDFRPSFDSMKIALLILASQKPQWFDKVILVEKMNSSGKVTELLSLATDDLINQALSIRENYPFLSHQNHVKKTVSYKPQNDRDLASSPAKRIRFDIFSDMESVGNMAIEEEGLPNCTG